MKVDRRLFLLTLGETLYRGSAPLTVLTVDEGKAVALFAQHIISANAAAGWS